MGTAALRLIRFTTTGITALAPCAALAAAVASFTPQGEVAQVRQAVAKFSQDVVRFGDPAADDPLRIRCDGDAVPAGQGRWTGAREWVYDFAGALPPGVRCEAVVAADFRTPQGNALDAGSFRFDTGGPRVDEIRPWSWEDVEEDQAFALRLDGTATEKSVQENVWCKLESVGERVPVQLLEGTQRSDILEAVGWEEDAEKEPQAFWVLQCARRPAPGSEMALVFGTGVATPSGLRSSEERRFEYSVREPFTVSTSCQRENAQAACIPVLPVAVRFSASIKTADARAIRLRAGDRTFAADLDEDEEDVVDRLQFNGPFPAQSELTLELPAELTDESGRPLANADSLPLRIKTDREPPLAKFAGGAFGIIERLAEGPGGPALLPLSVRGVKLAPEPDAQPSLRDLHFDSAASDARIIAWYTRVQRWDNDWIGRERAASDLDGAPLPPPVNDRTEDAVESRTVSLLQGNAGAESLPLPTLAPGERPLEVIGVPLAPGFHVLEAGSKTLGQSLLDPDYGASRRLFVRTSALVTNLAVHFKLGRENALAWVTELDSGAPVAGARVQVSTCDGQAVAQATTDTSGIAHLADLPPDPKSCTREDGYVGSFQSAYFVSARARNRGVDDLAFTWSSWQRGFESWRFNVPTSRDAEPDQRAHTVFDRTLLRAGETVSMKHLLRAETAAGFSLPEARPDTLVITHLGSDEEFKQPLRWRETASGGLSAENTWAIPKAAKLGVYAVRLAYQTENDDYRQDLRTGQFRVEEFRLPVLRGSVTPAVAGALVARTELPVQLQVDYVSGGAAAGLAVQVSATTRRLSPHWDDWDDYSFEPPIDAQQDDAGTRVVADKLAATLDASGSGEVTIAGLPQAVYPQRLALEATYPDPNGELQTLSSSRTLWPAAVVAGIQAESWISTDRDAQLQVLALDHDGQPRAGVPLAVRAVQHRTTSTRKRMVGGFYTYDSQTETTDLGTVCSGQSDANGRLRCTARLDAPGEIELVASARDGQGRESLAATSIWVTRQGELWFGGRDDDRMDVLTEKKEYAPGETARLQVRMPFRQATALVAVEREGILHQEVVQLSGSDPTVALKVDPAWGPNVYVSVLAVRGRVHEVPWTSFFRWGYRAPRQWWRAFRAQDATGYVPPTALIDLSKPAFRFGMVELRVGDAAHRLAVRVEPDAETHHIREQATVTIRATRPDGTPAAGAEVALAAVDEALLELMPNDSWDLLGRMMARRAWGVRTATAQMEIVGRRHYGRKAVAAGGGGGAGTGATRELLDTLLLWRPDIVLDEAGQATVQVPLNDALTRFRIVAVADLGADLFGTGQASVRTTQDLQIISGLPPLVREGDAFQAMLTLRNGTDAPMRVAVTPQAELSGLTAQTVDIPANGAQQLHWDVTVPTAAPGMARDELPWTLDARQVDGDASDRLRVSQRVVPAVPVTVRQATLVQLDGPYTLDVAPPRDALPAHGAKRGGLKLDLQPRLATGLPAIADWFARYPYSCLEQTASKAVGMDDKALWDQTMADLPTYLDEDGLAYYFPPRAGTTHGGSDTLTAWLLAASDEARRADPDWRLPEDAQQRMIQGLTDFVAGRVERRFWSPRADLDVRKLAAVEALSRYGAADARMLGSIAITPKQWPTSALLDWIAILRRVDDIAQRQERAAQAMNILRARLSVQGTRLIFSTEQNDGWWWLMQGGDVNAARLLLTVMDDADWQDDLGRLVSGFLARQKNGAWNTTTANLWGKLALQRFSRTHERDAVAGWTRARLGDQSQLVDWTDVDSNATDPAGRPESLFLPWTDAGEETLTVAHEGSGKPWLTLQSLAAVPLKAPFAAGYRVHKTVTPVAQADPALPAGQYSRGDILRVTLTVSGDADMTWVAVTDPIPGGATILGGGLGRDSAMATEDESSDDWWSRPAFEERSFESYRSYYRYLPQGSITLRYTLRLNNAGTFLLPPTRVEAIYAPEMFGEAPNAPVTVVAP